MSPGPIVAGVRQGFKKARPRANAAVVERSFPFPPPPPVPARAALLALARGASFSLRDSRARSLLLLPGLLSSGACLAFFAFAARGFDLLRDPLVGPLVSAADTAGLGPAAWTILAGLYFSAAAVACLACASVLGGPLLSRIGARADEEVLGSLPCAPPRAPRSRMGDPLGALLGASRPGAAGFAAAPLALVPLAGPAVLLGAAAWGLGRHALEGSMARRGLAPEERARWLRENRPAVLVFGLAAVAAAALPVAGGFLALPAAHAGAPFLLEGAGKAAVPASL